SFSVLLIASFIGGVWWSILGLVLLMNGMVYVFHKKQIDFIHENLGRTSDILKSYAQNLEWIEKTDWQSGLLKRRLDEIKNEIPVYTQISQLNKIIINLNYRFNPIVGTFLNLMFLWDLKQLSILNQWQKKY